jgi:hypothetical protein
MIEPCDKENWKAGNLFDVTPGQTRGLSLNRNNVSPFKEKNAGFQSQARDRLARHDRKVSLVLLMTPTARLNLNGITVLRFWNEQGICDPEKVLLRISEFLG